MGYMSQLHTIGEGDFFVSCLLHLSPEDLKACRLVNKTWNRAIKERVWGNRKARKLLEEKLAHRWKTTNPETLQMVTVPQRVEAIFCNNTHVFCGMFRGKVKVYSLTDGQWVRDLESGEENLGVEGICGGESIVVALLRGGVDVVTIWSSKEEMGRVHSFDADNHDGLEDGWVGEVKVTGNKAVLLLVDDIGSIRQLVVLQEGEHNWENKILDLEPFSTPRWGDLAVDKDWWAVTVKDVSRPGILKVKLWKEELFRQDIDLPGVSAGDVRDVVLESPFFVVGGTSRSGGRNTGFIKVFQLGADNLMEDLNSAASLLKTLQFPGFKVYKLLCTQLVWGCLMVAQDNHESYLVLFEKTALLDTATPPEQTLRNRIHLGTTHYNLVDMNTTSLVFDQNQPGTPEGGGQVHLCKKDFWMSNAIA